MLSAIAALSGSAGTLAYPSVATASVMLWATREGGDRLHQHPAVFDDQQQSQHEQQVIGTEQNVAHALNDERHPRLPTCDCERVISSHAWDG